MDMKIFHGLGRKVCLEMHIIHTSSYTVNQLMTLNVGKIKKVITIHLTGGSANITTIGSVLGDLHGDICLACREPKY